MTSIHKQIVVAGTTHTVQIDSSLELEEVEITGTDPISGKTVHISLSSILKPVSKTEASGLAQAAETPAASSSSEAVSDETARENVESALNDLFNY